MVNQEWHCNDLTAACVFYYGVGSITSYGRYRGQGRYGAPEAKTQGKPALNNGTSNCASKPHRFQIINRVHGIESAADSTSPQERRGKKGGADLVTALSRLYVNDLPHGGR